MIYQMEDSIRAYMTTKKTLICMQVMLLFAFLTSCNTDHMQHISSPDGKNVIEFRLIDSTPSYMVKTNDVVIIDTSYLGFACADQPDLNDNFIVENIRIHSKDEVWKPVWWQTDSIRNAYTEMEITLKETTQPARTLNLYLRAYNDGVAFRYEIPEQKNVDKIHITDELTEFNFADDYTSWWIPANYDSYEKLYTKSRISEIDSINTPVTLKSVSTYLSVHEADLKDYAGITLKKKEGTTLAVNLVPWPDGTKVKTEKSVKSPWRVLIITDSPGGLIESNLLMNLGSPNRLENTDWIEPINYVGIWWGLHIGLQTWEAGERHGATTERTKEYIDFAASHNIKGVLVEGWYKGFENWGHRNTPYRYLESYDDFDLPEVASYAKENGIDFIGYHETSGELFNYLDQVDSAFQWFEDLGIRYVKLGFANHNMDSGYHHHGQFMVNYYQKIIEKAANHKIMLFIHEPVLASGIFRSYPNVLAWEGVRGMEFNAWSAGNPPEHTTVLPFARGVAGPIEYTPGIFDIKVKRHRDQLIPPWKLKDNIDHPEVHTTFAKQLAYYVVLFSPVQMAADLIENYRDHLDAFRFISNVPLIWDETKVLDATISDYIVVARRKGANWYIGGITDELERNFEIPLDFLENYTYNATLYQDAPNAHYDLNPQAYSIKKQQYSNKDTLYIQMAPGGGIAIELLKIK
jgi:alpha-glucosidase